MYKFKMTSCSRTRSNINLDEVARLIYQTDRYIYPFWRTKIDDFVELVAPHMDEEGFIFNRRNIYVARETSSNQPLGILVALDSETNLDFNYAVFDDESSKFVINNYLMEVIKTRQTIPKSSILITNFCVAPNMRGYGIGSNLFYEYIWRMRARGINAFQLDCLQDDELTVQMYKKMGFVITDDTKYGFDGTDDSQVKTYTMLYTF